MRKVLLGCVLAAASFAANAEAVLSCEEVDQVGESLTGLGVYLEDENGEIGAGSPEDAALGDVVTGLADIAEAENDEDLANASLGMANAWADNDRDAFTDALADAVAKLAVISAQDCPD